MKAPAAVLFALTLAACAGPTPREALNASRPPGKQEISALTAESSFQESSGTLNLLFDDQGNWIRLSARGTAELVDDSPAARASAVMVASLRAKRTVAEFLSSQIKAETTTRRIARTYSRNFQSSAQSGDESITDSEATFSGDDAKRDANSIQAHRFASVLVERIQENSAAILKGVQVTYRAVEDGGVVVEVTATRQSIGASRQISRAMAGTL